MINNNLYKDEGVVLNNNWVIKYSVEVSQYENDSGCDRQSVTDNNSGNNADALKLDGVKVLQVLSIPCWHQLTFQKTVNVNIMLHQQKATDLSVY